MFTTKTVELSKAASSGNIPKIRTLLTLGVNINSLHLGGTAVWHAVDHNQFETVKYLVEQKANINIAGPQMPSPLHKAVHNNNFEIVEYLLQKGADVNKGTGDLTPLFIAVQSNNIQMIDLLLSYGADPNKDNPISQAFFNRNPEALVLLLDNGGLPSKHDVEKFLKDKRHSSIIEEVIAKVTFCPPIRAITLWKLKIKFEEVTSKEARHMVNVLTHKLYELSKVILPFYAKNIFGLVEEGKIVSKYDLVILSQMSIIYPPYKKILDPILHTFQNLYDLKQIHDDSRKSPDISDISITSNLMLDGRCKQKLEEYLVLIWQSPFDPSEINIKAEELDQLVYELGTMCIHDTNDKGESL